MARPNYRLESLTEDSLAILPTSPAIIFSDLFLKQTGEFINERSFRKTCTGDCSCDSDCSRHCFCNSDCRCEKDCVPDEPSYNTDDACSSYSP